MDASAYTWAIYSVLALMSYTRALSKTEQDFQIGSEDTNDIMLVGQQVCWVKTKRVDASTKSVLLKSWVKSS